ncbi:pilus assembly protein TadG-related protein [Kroppenstedtia eburnea]|uniref:pilus assembly protein TadG-related protein n=1 Tax=Kroppenstedtia eburnea TaxID=714067 RepID=UPI003630E196
MSRIFRHVLNKRGNVATLWVASLPIFALLFAFIGTLVTIWMTHSSSQMAADAASLAATQKMDAWVRQAMSEELNRADGTALSTDAQKRDFMLRVISGHERGLQNVVREYVQKHGGDKHGEIHIGKNGRIEVNARSSFQSLFFAEYFQDEYVYGAGSGPSRYYFDWLPSGGKTVKY